LIRHRITSAGFLYQQTLNSNCFLTNYLEALRVEVVFKTCHHFIKKALLHCIFLQGHFFRLCRKIRVIFSQHRYLRLISQCSANQNQGGSTWLAIDSARNYRI